MDKMDLDSGNRLHQALLWDHPRLLHLHPQHQLALLQLRLAFSNLLLGLHILALKLREALPSISSRRCSNHRCSNHQCSNHRCSSRRCSSTSSRQCSHRSTSSTNNSSSRGAPSQG